MASLRKAGVWVWSGAGWRGGQCFTSSQLARGLPAHREPRPPWSHPRSHPCPRAAIHCVLDIAARVQGIVEGSPLVDPMQFGWTTEEERSAATGGKVCAGGRVAGSWENDAACSAVCCGLVRMTNACVPPGTLVPAQWPGVTTAVKPANAGLRLFGGAAFERALQVCGLSGGIDT